MVSEICGNISLASCDLDLEFPGLRCRHHLKRSHLVLLTAAAIFSRGPTWSSQPLPPPFPPDSPGLEGFAPAAAAIYSIDFKAEDPMISGLIRSFPNRQSM